jgi:hypothetical protein
VSIIDADDYDLAVKHLEASAEIARLEGEELRSHGYEPVEVVGLDSVIWRNDGRLYTTEAALTEIWAIKEQKENS